MSRLTEIIENHKQLDQLFSIIKHYGVNAAFVSDALQQQFAARSEAEEGDAAEKAYVKDMLEDLQQFSEGNMG